MISDGDMLGFQPRYLVLTWLTRAIGLAILGAILIANPILPRASVDMAVDRSLMAAMIILTPELPSALGHGDHEAGGCVDSQLDRADQACHAGGAGAILVPDSQTSLEPLQARVAATATVAPILPSLVFIHLRPPQAILRMRA